jgi:SAM-dependent methyltransferase
MTVPDFSPLASLYAQARPRYPEELFTFLAALVDRRRRAWDCATGNGQAAMGLVEHFAHVVATDVSMAQIRHAAPHPRIDYVASRSEDSALAAGTIDLVTVAAAIHWFDLERFVTEAVRVLRPGGVLAAWTYHVGRVEPPLDEVFARFYQEVIRPYFAPAVKAVDERYETLDLPGAGIEAEDFWMSARWTLDQMLAFIRSWSATERYIQERGEDPAGLIRRELERIWGESDRALAVRWPLHLRIVRL